MVTAIEISNATDKKNAPERTKTYQTIISKYSDAEQEKFAELLGEVIMGMEQNPDQDFLGELYMLCELGNDASGQFFTPYDVCRCMVEISGGSNPAAENAEKAKRDAAREEDRMIGESFHNITELMFNLRREFVVELAPADCKKGFPVIARYMACAADDNFDLDLNLIGSILGVELSPKFVDSSGKDWYKILDEDGVYGTMPEKVLLAIAYSTMDSSYCGYWDKNWNVESQKYVYAYRENPTLDATYEMLMALGYEISDDEQALRDGTHKIFREYGSDEKKWSDCDYCKAAHPNCDKCCKACDEPCNAVQDCKKNEERTENDE